MSSSTPPGTGTVTVAELDAALERMESDSALIASALADREGFDLGAVHPDVAARIATRLLRVADRVTAAGTVTVGHVTSAAGPATGSLIDGQYASPRRWLEQSAGLAPSTAKAVLARGRDLREHSEPVCSAWLAGRISGDSVRELTSGISGVLATVTAPREEKARLRAEAVDVLLPVAEVGTPADLKRGIARLRLLADSAGEAKAVVEAYDGQSLTWVEVGALTEIRASLLHENAAALITVIGRYAAAVIERSTDVVHGPTCPLASPPVHGSHERRWCDCGASAVACLSGKDRWDHALAVAAGELAHDLLARGDLGTHHGVAPHVTVQVTLAELQAGLGGDLVVPGSDTPTVLGSDTVRRILCDSDSAVVVVDEIADEDPVASHQVGTDQQRAEPELAVEDPTNEDPATGRLARLSRLLTDTAIAVLYVGRAKRAATPAQQRALAARDRHCVFPGCRAHPRRCHAHHVVEWENDGFTDIDNMALLCVRHHISVHEGGWTLPAHRERPRTRPATGPSPHRHASPEEGRPTRHPPPPRLLLAVSGLRTRTDPSLGADPVRGVLRGCLALASVNGA